MEDGGIDGREREDQIKRRIRLAESTGKRRGILLASLRVKTKKEKDNERGKSEKSWESWGIEGSKGRGWKDRGWNSECEWKEAYWELSVNRSKMLKRLDGPDERALGKMNNGDRRKSRNGAEAAVKDIAILLFLAREPRPILSFHRREMSGWVAPRSNFLVSYDVRYNFRYVVSANLPDNFPTINLTSSDTSRANLKINVSDRFVSMVKLSNGLNIHQAFDRC